MLNDFTKKLERQKNPNQIMMFGPIIFMDSIMRTSKKEMLTKGK